MKTTNARIVAATNRDLQEAIRKGLMREDFFSRIHVIPIHIPPLKDRHEDIPLLIEHFLRQHARNTKITTLSGEMIEAPLSHDWPGNVRVLQNLLQPYCPLVEVDFIQPLP